MNRREFLVTSAAALVIPVIPFSVKAESKEIFNYIVWDWYEHMEWGFGESFEEFFSMIIENARLFGTKISGDIRLSCSNIMVDVFKAKLSPYYKLTNKYLGANVTEVCELWPNYQPITLQYNNYDIPALTLNAELRKKLDYQLSMWSLTNRNVHIRIDIVNCPKPVFAKDGSVTHWIDK